MEKPAMDLLMDFVLVLGAEGAADVLSILATELDLEAAPATRPQMELTIAARLEAGCLLDAAN